MNTGYLEAFQYDLRLTILVGICEERLDKLVL